MECSQSQARLVGRFLVPPADSRTRNLETTIHPPVQRIDNCPNWVSFGLDITTTYTRTRTWTPSMPYNRRDASIFRGFCKTVNGRYWSGPLAATDILDGYAAILSALSPTLTMPEPHYHIPSPSLPKRLSSSSQTQLPPLATPLAITLHASDNPIDAHTSPTPCLSRSGGYIFALHGRPGQDVRVSPAPRLHGVKDWTPALQLITVGFYRRFPGSIFTGPSLPPPGRYYRKLWTFLLQLQSDLRPREHFSSFPNVLQSFSGFGLGGMGHLTFSYICLFLFHAKSSNVLDWLTHIKLGSSWFGGSWRPVAATKPRPRRQRRLVM